MKRTKNTSLRKISEPSVALPALALGVFLFALPSSGYAQSTDDQADSQQNETVTEEKQSPPNADAVESDAAFPEDPATNALAPKIDAASLDRAVPAEGARDNLRQPPLDNITVNNNEGRDQAPGVAIGTMTLRPTFSQGVGVERTDDGAKKESRLYLKTGLKGSLSSDWSSHQLTVNGEGNFFRTISGETNDNPTYKFDALLRLDVTRDTTANLRAGFSHWRETATAANAIEGASVQAGVDQFSTGADITRDLGRLRATIGADLVRSVYSSAVLGNGVRVSQADRDNITYGLRGRIGYEISPALIPFIEISGERMDHDRALDRFGYRRDQTTYKAKAGAEIDLGEKLRGELAAGYALSEFEDSRLDRIAAFTLDGNATWSPRRGTDVNIGLTTAFEPSTVAGVTGAVTYTLRAEIAQAVTRNLMARANISSAWRDYAGPTIADQTVIATGAGLTWGLSRYLDLTGDASWEVTRQEIGPQSSIFQAMVGLALKR